MSFFGKALKALPQGVPETFIFASLGMAFKWSLKTEQQVWLESTKKNIP